MQMQINKRTWLKWGVISCGIVSGISLAVILILPAFISGDFTQQKIAQIVEDRFQNVREVGPVSFRWPNRVTISYLIIQKDGQDTDAPIQCEHIQSTVHLLPLLFKKIAIRKISIRQINYENRLLVRDLVTDTFSFDRGVLSTHARLTVNEGPATIKGVIDLLQKRPAFDLSFEAKDVHITQDIPVLGLIPIFTVKDGETGGILSLTGSVRGNGLGKEILNKELVADVKLEVRDGYIRGNKILSSLLEILGEKDLYSFDSMKAVIQIRDSKVYTQKMDIQGQIMSMNASGVAEFEGSIAYDALVKLNKEYLRGDIEKIAGLILKENSLPIEIRGTTKNPRVAIKLEKDNLEHIVKGLVNDFLHTTKEKRKKEAKNN